MAEGRTAPGSGKAVFWTAGFLTEVLTNEANQSEHGGIPRTGIVKEETSDLDRYSLKGTRRAVATRLVHVS